MINFDKINFTSAITSISKAPANQAVKSCILSEFKSTISAFYRNYCVKSGKTSWKNYGEQSKTRWKNYGDCLKSRRSRSLQCLLERMSNRMRIFVSISRIL